MSRSGLKREVRSVKGKHGTVKRTYWVKSQQAVTGFARKHKGKIAGAAVAAATIGALAYGNRHALKWGYRVAKQKREEHIKAGGSTKMLDQLRAAHAGAVKGYQAGAAKHGTLVTNTRKGFQKHLVDPKGRAKIARALKHGGSKLLHSEMTEELAGHFGTLAGAAAGLRGKGSMAARTGRSAVGAIIGNHVAKGVLNHARKRVGGNES